MVDIGIETNLQQLAILFAAFVGNFIATLPPYWKEQFKFKEYDIRIFFDYKFLGTALVTGVGSFVFITTITSTLESSIPENATLVLALISAFTIGLLGNKAVNGIMPSPNVEQKAKLAEKQTEAIIEDYENQKMIAGLKGDNLVFDGKDWKNTELTNKVNTDTEYAAGESNEVTPTQ